MKLEKLEFVNPYYKVLDERNPQKEIVLRHGHIAITNYNLGDNPPFEKLLSVWNKMYWRYEQAAGYYIPKLKEFRIGRGFDIRRLHRLFPDHMIRVENCPYHADKVEYNLTTPPRSDFQRVALTFMASQSPYKRNKDYTQQLIAAKTGEGKAMPNDTSIPTPNGWTMLGDIEVGDFVFNRYGKPVKVLGVYPQKGLQKTYKFTFKDGRTARCNPEHLWTDRRKSDKELITIPLSDMLKGYKSIHFDSDGTKHTECIYSIPAPKCVEFNEREVPVDPYVLGVLIGNGCLGEKALSISSGNPDVPKAIGKILNAEVLPPRYKNYTYLFITHKTLGKKGTINHYVQTKDVLKGIKKLIKSKSENKFIPKNYIRNSKDVRMALLQGLLDTDGHITKNKFQVSYSTTSKRLKNDIVELVRSLGFIAFVTKDNRTKYKSGECFKILIACDDKLKPTLFRENKHSMKRAKYAAKHYKTRRNNDFIKIIDIEEIAPTKQRCILIDDPEHLYLAEDYVPTHNTYCGVAISAYFKAKIIVVCPISKLLSQWKESYMNFTSLTDKQIMIVKGSKACEKIRMGRCKDIVVFIFTSDTIMAYIKNYGERACIEMLMQTGAYIKIIDEIHKDMRVVSAIEAMSNFNLNFYMSASPLRSDEKENLIFSLMYNGVPKFGDNFQMEEERHINIVVKHYKFIPNDQQIRSMYRPNVGLNTKSYERVLVNADDWQRKDFDQSINTMLRWSKDLLKKDNKILVLCQTVDGTKFMEKLAEKVFPGECSHYYATGMNKTEKEDALKKRVICATASSMGTGADVPGIQHVINICTYSNPIDATQLPGRARKLKDGTPVVYVEMVNMGYRKTVSQYESRRKYLANNAANGKIMTIR